MSSTSTNDNTSSSTFRVNYSDYVADITGSPKTARQAATTGIGHHINPLHNPYPNRPNQPAQQTGRMPQYGGGNEKCARCSKTVYVAEKKVGAGRSFHSSCFSCYTCKRKLDSTALSEHKGEIYCKSCYTKQFGAHGLISGVTMSTEQPVTREDRSSRRSSYANDFDAPGMINQQTRQRASSNENLFRDEYTFQQNNGSPKKYPQYNDISPERISPSNKKNDGVNAIIDTKYQRPPSPSYRKNDGVNAIIDTKYQRPPSPSRVGESNINTNRHRSTYIEEDDRSKYRYEGEKLSYGSGTSAVVQVPILYTKRSNSTADPYEMPKEPTRDNQRSRSPSITSNDSYRRQNSHDRQTDVTDDYSRSHINEDNNKRNIGKYSNDNTMNTIVSDNPLTRRNFYHSSSSSSSINETKYRNSTSNPNNSDREQYHSRESSPSRNTNKNQSPSSSTGYISSSTTRVTSDAYRVGPSRDSTSPSSTYVPQYDYRNSHTSSNSNFGNQRSPSPQSNDRTSTGLNEFVSKTNIAGNISSSNGNKNSTLRALAGNIPIQTHSDDDDFDN